MYTIINGLCVYVFWFVCIFCVFPPCLSDALTPLRCLRLVRLPGFYSPLDLIVAPQAGAASRPDARKV